MPTFTPGDTVPPTGLVSSSSAINDDTLGTDITPAGWPTTGKATAVEVELTATSQFTADGQVKVGISPPGTLASQVSGLSDAGGTFSGADGEVAQFRSGGTDAFHFDKFGGWRTDFVTHTSSGATSNRIELTSTETPAAGFDIRAKVRCSDWDDNSNRIICTTATLFGRFGNRLSLDTNSVNFRTWNVPATGMASEWAVPQSSFSLTDGEWIWLRVTFASGGDGKFWESTDGETWSLVDTITTPSWNTSLSTSLHVGATNQTNSGFAGDIAELLAFDGNGDLIHDLALDAMETDETRSWSSSVGSAYDYLSSGSRATGETIPATVRVRLDLDAPVAMDDWRLIIDAQTGDVTVDEILLEVERASTGWKVGFL